jgi:hypothetical protein
MSPITLTIRVLQYCALPSGLQMERQQLEAVYRNICVMLDDDLDEDLFLWELDTIASDVADEIDNLTDDEEAEAYRQTCLAPIVSNDIRELTVAAALALSSADNELDADELVELSRLCDEWEVRIQDAKDIWSD